VPVVADASAVLAPALKETVDFDHARAAEGAKDGWIVPALWWFGVRNVLISSERRGRMTENETAAYLSELSQFPITIDRAPDETVLMALARRHRLTVYDAAYLELALREGLPLATLDAALAQAARREGVTVLA
jgi:predicted nucleic acid-binding protein